MTRFISDPNYVPRWPASLKDETPLPFQAWRVMDQVNGQRSVAEIAQNLQLSSDQVSAAIEQAESWIQRAVQREQVVNEAMISTVSQCLMSVVGPMGEFMVDDALDEVGDHATLSQILSNIAGQLDESHLHAFVRQLRSKGLA